MPFRSCAHLDIYHLSYPRSSFLISAPLLSVVMPSAPAVSVSAFVATIQSYPFIAANVSLDTLVLFFRLTVHLKPALRWTQAHTLTEPPNPLPHDISLFLSRALNLEPSIVANCWSALRGFVWSSSQSDPDILSGDLLQIFLDHGVPLGIGERIIISINATSYLSRCVCRVPEFLSTSDDLPRPALRPAVRTGSSPCQIATLGCCFFHSGVWSSALPVVFRFMPP